MRNTIKGYAAREPILTVDIARNLAKARKMSEKQARAAVAVCMQRIIQKKEIANLHFYKNGVYYLAKQTVFGTTKIDNEKLIELKYLMEDNGYETGPLFLNKIGLTTLMPNMRYIATNIAKENTRVDRDLNIVLKKPRTQINRENKRYLQFLDVLDYMEKAPLDAKNPLAILVGFVQEYKLKYDKILALANRYYSERVIIKIADVAEEGA
ncbi:MAG: hypothetical protein H8E98_07135 [Bacteroidetes bacterium]|nr:hypothetical protein [Bacteroidota bacterium]